MQTISTELNFPSNRQIFRHPPCQVLLILPLLTCKRKWYSMCNKLRGDGSVTYAHYDLQTGSINFICYFNFYVGHSIAIYIGLESKLKRELSNSHCTMGSQFFKRSRFRAKVTRKSKAFFSLRIKSDNILKRMQENNLTYACNVKILAKGRLVS